MNELTNKLGQRPCGNCPHPRNRHAAHGGHCLECRGDCSGWMPALEDDRTAMMLGLVPDKRAPEQRLEDAVATGGESLKYHHVNDGEAFKMPSVWSAQLGLPDVGPIWKDYPITKSEFLARQGGWDENGRRLP